MKRFPAYIDVAGSRVVILGGGEAALAKARLVIAAGARPTLIWPEIAPAVSAALQADARLIEATPAKADLAGARLIFVAVDDDAAAAFWGRAARRAGALVNVVDRPDLCDFTTPSIIDRDRLTIAISTDGAAPVYAKALRERIEAMIPARAGQLLDFAQSYRESVGRALAPQSRRRFWERFFSGAAAAAVLSGKTDRAHALMREALSDDAARAEAGVVHIVGAGPGDPDLLTLRALRIVQSADIIFYDRLVSKEVLSLVRRDARRVYVGKAKGDHAVAQGDIEQRLIAHAQAGEIVVRLKGGDPFVFGRGGEEADAVRAAGVDVHVTPGITAAAGCAAAANTPLTHRDLSQSATFVTGYAKDGREPDLDWAALAALRNTLVIYMGVGRARQIGEKLVANGRDADTPAAIIENGTRADQMIVKGALGELGDMVERAGIVGPALIIIGAVAARADGAGLIDLAQTARSAA